MALQKKGFNFNFPSDTNNDEESLRYINLSVIDEDENNSIIYDHDDESIEELARDIANVGLAQPLTVRRNPKLSERYIVISGHRRRKACLLNKMDKVPCIVKKEETELDCIKTQMMLITSNIETRARSLDERAREVSRLKELINQFKAAGGEHKGKIDDTVAKMMGITSSYVRQIVRLSNADPSVKRLLDDEKVTIAEALKLTSMDEDEAAQIVKKVKKAKTDTEIKTAKEPLKATAQQLLVNESPINQCLIEQPLVNEVPVEQEPPKKPVFSEDAKEQRKHEERIYTLLGELDDSYKRLKDVLTENEFAPSIIRATTEIERLIENNLTK